MLGKLLKQEWRATWKVPTFLLLLTLFCSVAAGAVFALPIWESEWVGLPISAMMVLFLFYFVIIGCTLGISIYLAVRYYKNMFTDEGYLTHTLPVTARQLYWTKIFNMSAWTLISTVVVMAGMFFFAMMVAIFAAGESLDAQFWAELIMVMNEPELEGWQLFCVIMFLFFVISCFSSSIIITASVNIGQLVRKHRILGAVGAYFAIYTVMQVIAMIVMIPMTIGMVFEIENMETMSVFALYNPLYGVMTVAAVIMSVALYFVSEYILRKKLELE